MSMTLLEALAKLDPTNEDHWTADGLPRIDPLSEMVGIAVQRQSVTAVAPEFTRSNPTLPTGDATVVVNPEPATSNPKQDQELSDEGAPVFNEPTPEPDPEPEVVREEIANAEAEIKEAQAAFDEANQYVREAHAAREKARKHLEYVTRKNRKTPAQRRISQRDAIKRFQRSEAQKLRK